MWPHTAAADRHYNVTFQDHGDGRGRRSDEAGRRQAGSLNNANLGARGLVRLAPRPIPAMLLSSAILDASPFLLSCTVPACRHAWTPDEDKKLRALVEKFKGRGDIPWMQIALQANFGHNSGSCKKRFEELPPLKWADSNVFLFKGKAGNGEVVASKKRFS